MDYIYDFTEKNRFLTFIVGAVIAMLSMHMLTTEHYILGITGFIFGVFITCLSII
jgi:multisubunit Na+/H+ antiporter MnhE subunit